MMSIIFDHSVPAELLDDLAIRRMTTDELADFVQLEALVYGWEPHESRVRFYREFLDGDYTLGVFDRGRLVASHGMVRLKTTVPGGARVDAAGLTCLTVHPQFRGSGLMSELTHHALDLLRREEGVPIAVGVPNHSRTHLRYGFGVAARYANVELELDGQRSLVGPPQEGHVEYIDGTAALTAMQELSQRMSGVRNGWIPRKPCADAYRYSGAGKNDGDYGPTAFAVHRTARGAMDGFLSYRLASGADPYGRPAGTLQIIELFGTTEAAQAQLWQHCLNNPLITRVTATRRPVNEPIATLLNDPRAWHQVVRDDLILRVLDVPAALAARRYSRDDTVVIHVYDDAEEPARLELSGGLAGASCRPVDRAPDVALSLSALGAAYLGDVSLIDLAAFGQVSEHQAGGLRRAAAMFSWSPAPWVQDTF